MMFSIYDLKAEAYMTPFWSQNEATAIRSLEQTLTDAAHPFCSNPEDYCLWVFGTFDEDQGRYEERHNGPMELVRCFDLMKAVTHEKKSFVEENYPEHHSLKEVK